MKQFITLLKREFWENKTSTFYAPLVISFGFIVLVLFSGIQSEVGVSAFKTLTFGLTFGTMPSILLFFLPLLIAVYALNSLYEERKNKSLLFWRSMPVSDTKTVLSKVFFGVIGIPMLFIITWLLMTTIILTVNFGFTYLFGDASISETTRSFSFFMNLIAAVSLGFLALSIMMLPYYTYLTFISSISNRVPFIVALMPFIALAFVNMLIPSTLLIYDYIFMPFELAIKTAIEVTKTMLENSGLINLFSEKMGFSMQEYNDSFNKLQDSAKTGNVESMSFVLNWGAREIYTLIAAIAASVTFTTFTISARKRIQSV